MEDKKTVGQQAEQPAQGTQEQQAPGAWLEAVNRQMSAIGKEIDATEDEDTDPEDGEEAPADE